ncbi:MAG: hypothetical protein ABI190_07110 [Casimicrobiaceae bacterium]
MSAPPTAGGVLPLDDVVEGALIDEEGAAIDEEGVLVVVDGVDELVSVDGVVLEVVAGVEGVTTAGGGVGVGVVSAGGVLLQATSVAQAAMSITCDRFMVILYPVGRSVEVPIVASLRIIGICSHRTSAQVYVGHEPTGCAVFSSGSEILMRAALTRNEARRTIR